MIMQFAMSNTRMCLYVLLYYSKRKPKKKKNTQRAQAQCCTAVPVTLKSKSDFVFFGDATGGCAVWMQRWDSWIHA